MEDQDSHLNEYHKKQSDKAKKAVEEMAKHPLTSQQVKKQAERLDPIKPGHPAYFTDYHIEKSKAALKEVQEMIKHPVTQEECIEQWQRVKAAQSAHSANQPEIIRKGTRNPNTQSIIRSAYLEIFIQSCPIDLRVALRTLQTKDFAEDNFEYWIINAALYSSKIEGNSLDINAFYRSRQNTKGHPKKDEIAEIENLINVYQFVFGNPLTQKNFLSAHKMFSKKLLPIEERGKIRKHQVGIRDGLMNLVYTAVEPELVQGELDKLFVDVHVLLSKDLTNEEVFYYASLIHIWIAKIHPFVDGNGRAARLAEKWFLFSKLGKGSFSILSEMYYWDHRSEYYKNIALGQDYHSLYWEKCLPFILMLPQALKLSLQLQNGET